MSVGEMPWGKLDGDGNRHALLAHALDVAAVLEVLLDHPRLPEALQDICQDQAARARLALVAAIHDIGKLHPGFQAIGWPAKRHPPRVRHCEAGFGLCYLVATRRTGGAFPDLLRAILGWFDRPETVVGAVFAHHGKPALLGSASEAEWRWQDYDGLTEANNIANLLREIWPEAFAQVPPTRLNDQAIHAFAGLLALADWIGSDRDFFSFEAAPRLDYMTCTRRRARGAVAAIALALPPNIAGARAVLREGHEPRAAQRDMIRVGGDAKVVVLEAETGAGKTEAALMRFQALRVAGLVEGLYFALPTRAAARQIHGRVNDALQRLFGADAPEAVLAIPGQRVAGDATGRPLPEFKTRWDDSADPVKARWAAEHATRFLAAPVAVGTVDQALLATLQVKHAPLRAVALQRSLLVVDEVHASDLYMTRLLKSLLADHVAGGGHALLMSATLGSAARVQLAGGVLPRADAASDLPYPAIWYGEESRPVKPDAREKAVAMETRLDMRGATVAAAAVAAAGQGARVLVIRNTVAAAQEAFDSVLEVGARGLLMQVAGGPALHHARFAAEDRRLLDQAAETALAADPDRPRGGVIVIGM